MNQDEAKLVVDRLRRARGQIEESSRDLVGARLSGGRHPASRHLARDRASFKIVATGLRQCLAGEGDDNQITTEQLEKVLLSLA
jgi:DNA-binding FrmR family transcriptional regulator